MGLLNPGGPIAQSQRNRCSIPPVEVISRSGVRSLGVDLCFEASGVPSAVPQGIEILRNRGVYLIPGQYSAAGPIAIQPELITFKALHIIGSSQYSLCDVHDYLVFLEQNPQLAGSIEKLGTKFPLAQINEAMAYARSGKNVKTMLI